uniref:NME/NM23 family member 7 n=1 Tax=Laticauda laticaudata TaxID=8630 RepID=A0A8C5RVH0_LATLA
MHKLIFFNFSFKSDNRTLALLKPDVGLRVGEVIDMIINSDFNHYFSKNGNMFITSGPVVAMEILGDDAIGKWKQLLGPANSIVARTDAPNSIRARFGSDSIRNVAHGPDSFASAASVSFSNKHLIAHSVHDLVSVMICYEDFFYKSEYSLVQSSTSDK